MSSGTGQYVALLDILGFKDIINKNSHDDVVILFNQFTIHVQMVLSKQKATTDKYGRTVFDLSESTINSNIISDSLIFWTNDNKTTAFFELIECLHFLTTFCHNLSFIFLRGGLTYGNFFFHNNGIIRGKDTLIIHHSMVGKALVDVYEIEKELQIAGCIISKESIEEAQTNDPENFKQKWETLISEKKIIEYEMPLKNGTRKYWTINWVRNLADPTLEELRTGFASYNKSVDALSVKEKVDNTIKYYSHVKNNVFK